jgi:hypothetical protein
VLSEVLSARTRVRIRPPIEAAPTPGDSVMPRPLWFESPSGKRMYAGAEKDPQGWAVRLFDQDGRQISPIVFRVTYEIAADETIGELPVEIVSDIMNAMRRQIMEREAVFLAQPVK